MRHGCMPMYLSSKQLHAARHCVDTTTNGHELAGGRNCRKKRISELHCLPSQLLLLLLLEHKSVEDTKNHLSRKFTI